jgi:hypothetical protein
MLKREIQRGTTGGFLRKGIQKGTTGDCLEREESGGALLRRRKRLARARPF